MDKNYKYKTACGKEASAPIDTYAVRIVLGWEFKDCDEYEDSPMSEECKKCMEQKLEAHNQIVSENSSDLYDRKTWSCMAKAEDEKYKSLDKPFDIDWFDSYGGNLKRNFVLELIVQTEDFRRVFYHSVCGEGCYQPMNDLEDILEEIYNKYENEDGVCEIMMNNVNTGEILPIEFDGFSDFYDSLLSARVVKCYSELVDD